jgi:hypothetical protein
MTEQIHVIVTHSPTVGFVSQASHKVPRSLTAQNLDQLRRRLIVLILSRRRPDRPVAVKLDLDAAAAQEAQRRRSGEGRPGPDCG